MPELKEQGMLNSRTKEGALGAFSEVVAVARARLLSKAFPTRGDLSEFQSLVRNAADQVVATLSPYASDAIGEGATLSADRAANVTRLGLDPALCGVTSESDLRAAHGERQPAPTAEEIRLGPERTANLWSLGLDPRLVNVTTEAEARRVLQGEDK